MIKASVALSWKEMLSAKCIAISVEVGSVVVVEVGKAGGAEVSIA